MAQYLLMRLYGPLASWGDIAVGESRHSVVSPSRSALVGLLAAALGIDRGDDAAQAALALGYRFGVKLECSGSPLRDFHTVQTGVPGRKERFRSRRQALAADKVDTLLSTREYRCDSLAIVAVEATQGAPFSLEQLASALRQPHFTLYLGRKSCPLALPLAPRLTDADNLRNALDDTKYQSLLALLAHDPAQQWPNAADRRAFAPGQYRYYWEDGMTAGMDASFESVRHDQPTSRRRWQFAPRRELVFLRGSEQ